MMTIAEQMQAQIAFNKALPQIQAQLTNGNIAHIPYCDSILQLLQDDGFDAQYNQYDNDLCVKFKEKSGPWADR